VSNEPLPFDPLQHSVMEVLVYLHAADPEEQDRVVAIERHMSDKPRRGILKKFEGVGL
jgi:hypothetical protein